MNEKFKKVFLFIGSIITGVLGFLFLRGRSDGRGSRAANDRNKEIEGKRRECGDALDEVRGTAKEIRDDAGRASDHAGRAESILQAAMDRSKK